MGAVSAPGYGTHLLGRLERAANTATLGAMIADAPSGRVFGPARRSSPTAWPGRRPAAVIGDRGDGAGDARGRAPARSNWAAARPRCAPRPRSAGAWSSSTSAACASPPSTPAAAPRPARTPAATPSTPKAACAGSKGVWVADGSILPSCPGVNPQVSIMAIAAGVGEAASSGG